MVILANVQLVKLDLLLILELQHQILVMLVIQAALRVPKLVKLHNVGFVLKD